MPSIADILRREIERAGQSLSELARATGIPQPRLWHFVNGDQQSLKLESAEALLRHFGYVVVKKPATGQTRHARGRTTKRGRR
jgi:hypothetical protein